MTDLKLLGRVFISGQIHAVTGLHIGGSESLFSIGGLDNTVIVDPITQQPYIPGSSLRGKMRSLVEKFHGKVTGHVLDQVTIHECEKQDEYNQCSICNLFGVPAGGNKKQLMVK